LYVSYNAIFYILATSTGDNSLSPTTIEKSGEYYSSTTQSIKITLLHTHRANHIRRIQL